MKKKGKIYSSLLLGAGAVLIAGPASVFATTTETDQVKVDNLSVTVTDTCTLSRASTAHTDGDDGATPTANPTGTWGTEAQGTANTLSGSIGGNAAIANFGKSHFSVTCNHANGWTVDVTSNGLSDGTNTFALSKNVAVSAGSQKFGVVASSNDSDLTIGTTTSATMVSASKAKSAAAFTVQYSVATTSATPTGTYAGEVVYTLAEADSTQQDNSGGTTNNNGGGDGLLVEEEEETPTPTPTNLPTLTMASNYYTTNNYTTNNNTTNNSSTSNNSSDNSTTNNSSTDNSTTETSDDKTSTTSDDASDGKTTALGVVKSSSDTGTTESTSSSNNTATIAAVAVAGTAALAAGGYILYNKSKEKTGE